MERLRKNSKCEYKSQTLPMEGPLSGLDWDFVQRRFTHHLNAYLNNKIKKAERKEWRDLRESKKIHDPVTVYAIRKQEHEEANQPIKKNPKRVSQDFRKKEHEEDKHPLKKNPKRKQPEPRGPMKKNEERPQAELSSDDIASDAKRSRNRAKSCRMPESCALAGLLAILDSNGKLTQTLLNQLKKFLLAAAQSNPKNLRSYLKMIDGYTGLSPDAAVCVREFLMKTCTGLTPTQLALLLETLQSEFQHYLRGFEKLKTQQGKSCPTSGVDTPSVTTKDTKSSISPQKGTSSKNSPTNKVITVVSEHSNKSAVEQPGREADTVPIKNIVPDGNSSSKFSLEDTDDSGPSARPKRFNKNQRKISEKRVFETLKTEEGETFPTSGMDTTSVTKKDTKSSISRQKDTSSKKSLAKSGVTFMREHSDGVGMNQPRKEPATVPIKNKVLDSKKTRTVRQTAGSNVPGHYFKSVAFNYGPDDRLMPDMDEGVPSNERAKKNSTNRTGKLKSTRTSTTSKSSSKRVGHKNQIGHPVHSAIKKERKCDTHYKRSKISARDSRRSKISASFTKTVKRVSHSKARSVKAEISLDSRDIPAEGTTRKTVNGQPHSRYVDRPYLGYANRMEPHYSNSQKTETDGRYYLRKVDVPEKLIIKIDGQDYYLVKYS